MATVASATVSLASLYGLRVAETSNVQSTGCVKAPAAAPVGTRASVLPPARKAASLAAATSLAASLLLSGSALAAKVEVGDDVGRFVFTPDTITVAAGEPIDFELVGEVGHNIVFEVPPGAPEAVASELAANSMGEYDLLSEDESVHTAKLSKPGTYKYYCTPHRSANMTGTIIVK